MVRMGHEQWRLGLRATALLSMEGRRSSPSRTACRKRDYVHYFDIFPCSLAFFFFLTVKVRCVCSKLLRPSPAAMDLYSRSRTRRPQLSRSPSTSAITPCEQENIAGTRSVKRYSNMAIQSISIVDMEGYSIHHPTQPQSQIPQENDHTSNDLGRQPGSSNVHHTKGRLPHRQNCCPPRRATKASCSSTRPARMPPPQRRPTDVPTREALATMCCQQGRPRKRRLP